MNELVRFKDLRKKPFLIVMVAIVLVEIIYLMYFNFAHIYQCIDEDAAKLMTHMVEIVRNRKILIPNWVYVSTLELDTSMLLAIPFYIITKNVWISFAISNCIYIPILLYVVIWIFKNINVATEYALGCCSLIFVPYFLGMVDYTNMLFIKTAQYNIKVLIPLLAVAILTYKKINMKKIVAIGIWLFLVFICAFSSGPLVFVTVIAPLVMAFIINLFITDIKSDKRLYFANAIMLILGTILTLVGLHIYNGYNNSPAKVSSILLDADSIPGKMHETMMFFFQVINALPPNWVGGVELTSSNGIITGGGFVLRFILTCFIIVCVFRYIVSFFKNESYYDSEDNCSKESINYLIVIILVNVLIKFLQNYGAQRYYLVEFFPMLIISTIFFSKWIDRFKKSAKNMMSIATIAGISFIWYSSVLWTNSLLPMQEHYGHAFEMCSRIEALNVDNVITIDNSGLAEVSRLILPNQKISNYSTEEQNYYGMDWYDTVDDSSYYGHSSIIITYSNDLNSLFGEQIASKYEYLETISDYYIFISDELGAPTEF